MSIRVATESDLPKIVEIYNQAVETGFSTADTEPTTLKLRCVWFNEHRADKHPIYVEEIDGVVCAWCSLSPYRSGRKALRYTAEISYYVDSAFQRQGIASRLVQHAISDCKELQIRTLFAIILDANKGSIELLKKLGFEEWGYLPNVADFDGVECSHVYLGKRIDGITSVPTSSPSPGP